MSRATTISSYREAIQIGNDTFTPNVILLHHRNPYRKLRGLVNLVKAGHHVTVAPNSIDLLMIDGVISAWAVLEEWANV